MHTNTAEQEGTMGGDRALQEEAVTQSLTEQVTREEFYRKGMLWGREGSTVQGQWSGAGREALRQKHLRSVPGTARRPWAGTEGAAEKVVGVTSDGLAKVRSCTGRRPLVGGPSSR